MLTREKLITLDLSLVYIVFYQFIGIYLLMLHFDFCQTDLITKDYARCFSTVTIGNFYKKVLYFIEKSTFDNEILQAQI